jgi:transcriptional regulator with XRE-family HTH domain
LDLELRQKDVARRLRVNVNTVTNWELGRCQPALRFFPKIVRFLGYVPRGATSDSSRLADRLNAYRRLRGLSQRELALRLGVDESTVWHWERGKSKPDREHAERIEALVRPA